MAAAKRDGYVIKLLAIAERVDADENGVAGVSVRVHPALIERDHPLGAVHGAFNAVFVEAEAAGSLMFYGAGAGGVQTASAVLGDLVSAAKRHVAGGPGLADSVHANLAILPIDRAYTRYQISLEVTDQPGILAKIANVFADRGVSIETVEQSVRQSGGKRRSTATLEVGTHVATDASLSSVVAALAANAAVESITSVIRVEGI
jgi:homoserine dehydrogenase